MEEQLSKWIEDRSDFMEVLSLIEHLDLKDSWLCAGSVRNYVWSSLSGQSFSLTEQDLDVIFYDPAYPYEANSIIQERLVQTAPMYHWEVKNQVYMHNHNFADETPFNGCYEAIAHFPEKCTAVAVRLNQGKLEWLAPYGLQELLSMTVSPTPFFAKDERSMAIYRRRIQQKNWQEKWPALKIFL